MNMNNMNPVIHFEFPAEDQQRMVDFYTKAFGWKVQMLGPSMGDYIIVTTTQIGEDHVPTEPGRINGGFFKKTKDAQHPSVVIGVDDIREGMKRVQEAGGTIVGGQKPGEPDDIPGIGLYISFLDTEGNRISMIQPAPMTKTQPESQD